MARSIRTWVPAAPPKTKPKVSDSIKRSVKEQADKIVEAVLKPEYIKPPPIDNERNYLADIYTKWYRNYFYFCAKYNSPSPHAISPSFEIKYARMEHIDEDTFNLAYRKHNEKWFEVYQNLSMRGCLELIQDDPDFMP